LPTKPHETITRPLGLVMEYCLIINLKLKWYINARVCAFVGIIKIDNKAKGDQEDLFR
jgi:hypothetical protein